MCLVCPSEQHLLAHSISSTVLVKGPLKSLFLGPPPPHPPVLLHFTSLGSWEDQGVLSHVAALLPEELRPCVSVVKSLTLSVGIWALPLTVCL